MVGHKTGLQIAFSERTFDLLGEFRQVESRAGEAGGILLGQFNDQTALVTRASVPTERDCSSRYSFVRDAKAAQIIIDHEFHNSAGRTVYLGEWHTHPEPLAEPSDRDRHMIASSFRENDLCTDFLLLAILGTSEDYLGLYNGSALQRAELNS